MIVNQANLRGLNTSYSTAYNKAFDGVKTNYEKIATTVPSTTAETNYKWLGQIPQMREWIGEREIQKLSAYGYSITNKKFEIRYVLTQAGIADYKLDSAEYGKKDAFIVNRQNGIKTIAQVNSTWGIDNDFFFRDGVFYWGCKPEQENIYVLEESENILSLKKYGDLYEIETLGVPWIHHSQEVEVSHSKYSGVVKVEKTIVKSDANGYTRMYIYFKGG